MIPSHVAIKAGVHFSIGDTITVAVGQWKTDDEILTQHDSYTNGETLINTAEKTYTIVGTYERVDFEEHSAPGYTVITKTDILDDMGRYSAFVTLKNAHDITDYAKSSC
ncbi:MAG: hypothetical protein UHS41_06255 [Lachnospiraceae bacterium]|nr:hypothetical protein [Lachnospiraceae bacterium]